jgi:hypothetical protein
MLDKYQHDLIMPLQEELGTIDTNLNKGSFAMQKMKN